MNLPLGDTSLTVTAQAFWAPVGGVDEWPCDLDGAIVLSDFLLDVVRIPGLSLGAMEAWLEGRCAAYRFPCASRSLHGCLFVHRNNGYIFIDAQDSVSDQRFTLAHELSHFLLDYHLPRQRSCDRFGNGILDVLDGLRAPTLHEQVHAALHGVNVTPAFHLLEKEGDGRFVDARIWNAENRADQLAFELMAPAEIVCANLRESGAAGSYFPCVTAAKAILEATYGLPAVMADTYARHLARTLTGGPTALSFLGLE